MKDIYSFYSKILNLKDSNELDNIKQIVKEEKEKLLNKGYFLDGLCIYIAREIELRLKSIGIKTYLIDLNELVNVDHVILIAEYRYESIVRRVLIDPTFEQFAKTENKTLIKLKEWPSEKIPDKILDSLLKSGIIEVDNDIFQMYVNSFTEEFIEINLDEYLLNHALDKIL